MNDIANQIGLNKVHAVVDDFYDRVQQHPRLAAPFAIVANWPEHKAHLTHSWWVTSEGSDTEISLTASLRSMRWQGLRQRFYRSGSASLSRRWTHIS